MFNTKELNEVFDALDVIAVSGGKAYKDKKIDMADLPILIDIAMQAKVFLDAIEGFNVAISEAQDLDMSEQVEMVNRFFGVAKKYEEARKA